MSQQNNTSNVTLKLTDTYDDFVFEPEEESLQGIPILSLTKPDVNADLIIKCFKDEESKKNNEKAVAIIPCFKKMMAKRFKFFEGLIRSTSNWRESENSPDKKRIKMSSNVLVVDSFYTSKSLQHFFKSVLENNIELNLTNCAEYYMFANHYDNSEIVEKIKHYIKTNMNTQLACNVWLHSNDTDLHTASIEYLISSQTIRIFISNMKKLGDLPEHIFYDFIKTAYRFKMKSWKIKLLFDYFTTNQIQSLEVKEIFEKIEKTRWDWYQVYILVGKIDYLKLILDKALPSTNKTGKLFSGNVEVDMQEGRFFSRTSMIQRENTVLKKSDYFGVMTPEFPRYFFSDCGGMSLRFSIEANAFYQQDLIFGVTTATGFQSVLKNSWSDTNKLDCLAIYIKGLNFEGFEKFGYDCTGKNGGRKEWSHNKDWVSRNDGAYGGQFGLTLERMFLTFKLDYDYKSLSVRQCFDKHIRHGKQAFRVDDKIKKYMNKKVVSYPPNFTGGVITIGPTHCWETDLNQPKKYDRFFVAVTGSSDFSESMDERKPAKNLTPEKTKTTIEFLAPYFTSDFEHDFEFCNFRSNL